MKLQTIVPIPKSDFPMDYQSRILSLGSCFAENMGEKFEYFKFQNLVNPFGIIFNPVSLEKLIRRAMRKEYFTEADIFYHNERWNCYEVHSELSAADKDVFLQTLNQIVEMLERWLTEATHVILTLGTAWVYRNVESCEIVANCHKVPQKQFVKELLSVEDIQKSLVNIVALVRSVNKEAKFIFTVSPVRHIKDGFVENQQSKAHLLTALHQSFDFKTSEHSYFPSYEIMMDELRDYRFYAADMLHPSALAIQYIWERFGTFVISEACNSVMNEVEAVQKARQHRPFDPDSEDYRKFQQNLSVRIEKLQKTYPFMEF